MKSIIVVLSVFVSSTVFAQVPDLDLISLMNFHMPAMKVQTTASNKVSVRLDAAVLSYDDNMHDFQQSIDELSKLATLFQLPLLNSLVIEFEPSDCVTDSVQKDIFYCQAQGPRVVKGADSDFMGDATESSAQILVSNVYVLLTKHIDMEPNFQSTSYTATVVLRSPENNLDMHLKKSKLSPRQK